MDYKKRKLDKISCNNSYEEIDTRLATGWYVDSVGKNKKKKYKTKKSNSCLPLKKYMCFNVQI